MVVLVGTSHRIQMREPSFRSFLEQVCRRFSIKAIAEEMNEEGLREQELKGTIPMCVATSLDLPHCHCDPGRAERRNLGIRQENEIRRDTFFSESKPSDAEMTAEREGAFRARERYWLEQLGTFSPRPVLFVCGASHVESFCNLLKAEGDSVEVAAYDWEPNNTLEGDAP